MKNLFILLILIVLSFLFCGLGTWFLIFVLKDSSSSKLIKSVLIISASLIFCIANTVEARALETRMNPKPLKNSLPIAIGFLSVVLSTASFFLNYDSI